LAVAFAKPVLMNADWYWATVVVSLSWVRACCDAGLVAVYLGIGNGGAVQ
jgi:hypothetical protein